MKTRRTNKYTVTAKVWLYPGESASWHFFTIPKKESSELKETFKGLTKGWGSLPVEATIGGVTWKTSIFPDSKSGTYILPLKAKVRKDADIYEGDTCTVTFHVAV